MATNTQEAISAKATLPPGPRPLPILGNLLSLRRDPLGFFQEIQRTYGDIATLYIGRSPIVLLSRPEYVRYVLVEHPRQFNNREVTQNNNDGFVSEGLLSIDGEKHRQQRRAVQPAFHKKRVENYASIMEQYTQEMLSSWQPGETVDMSRAMQELTVRIVGKCLFDLDLRNQLDNIGSTFNDMIGGQVDVLETLFNLRIDNSLTTYGKRKAALRRLDMLIYTLLAERKNDVGRDRGDMLSMLLSAHTGGEPDELLSDKQIHDHMITFIAAGHETTANALVWTLYLLSKHPEVRVKLMNELHTVLKGSAPTVEDMARLPYTEWVLQESMRLYPPAWIQGRFTKEDLDLDGTHIPAGTVVMMSQWVMHRRADIWKDAEVFRPERWDPEKGEQVPAGAYFPFGAGPRICIGMPFAQLEAKIILINLLQSYIPQAVPSFKPDVKPVITLRPKEHLRMQLIPTIANEQDSARWSTLSIANESALQENQGCLGFLLSLMGLSKL
jgi:cytochrome P450